MGNGRAAATPVPAHPPPSPQRVPAPPTAPVSGGRARDMAARVPSGAAPPRGLVAPPLGRTDPSAARSRASGPARGGGGELLAKVLSALPGGSSEEAVGALGAPSPPGEGGRFPHGWVSPEVLNLRGSTRAARRGRPAPGLPAPGGRQPLSNLGFTWWGRCLCWGLCSGSTKERWV